MHNIIRHWQHNKHKVGYECNLCLHRNFPENVTQRWLVLGVKSITVPMEVTQRHQSLRQIKVMRPSWPLWWEDDQVAHFLMVILALSACLDWMCLSWGGIKLSLPRPFSPPSSQATSPYHVSTDCQTECQFYHSEQRLYQCRPCIRIGLTDTSVLTLLSQPLVCVLSSLQVAPVREEIARVRDKVADAFVRSEWW